MNELDQSINRAKRFNQAVYEIREMTNTIYRRSPSIITSSLSIDELKKTNVFDTITLIADYRVRT
jgi:hypothetical protein